MLTYIYGRMYSTREAAFQVGVDFRTLNRWIAQGKIVAPPVSVIAGIRVRLWSKREIGKLRKRVPSLKFKSSNGRRKKKKGKRA